MSNSNEKGVCDKKNARKDFLINVYHADTSTHLHIVNQR